MSKLPWRLLRQRLLRQQFTNHVLCLDEQGAPQSGLGSGLGSGFFSSEVCGHYGPSGSHHIVGVASFWKHWEEVLQTHGVPEPMWSVKWILEHVMRKGGTKGTEKSACASPDGAYITVAQVAMATDLLNQRLKRVPVQYLIGEWDFREVTLSMTPPVFVPTTETEELVGHVIRSCGLQENTSNNTTVSVSPSARSAQTDLTGQYVRILDLCCGSGAIAVSLLKECPLVEVVAVDVSREAVELTQQNAERNGVGSRLSILHTSILGAAELFQREGIWFDCIVSNPPYLTAAEMPLLEPEIRLFMDQKALYGGVEGTDLAMEILSTCRHYLKPHGDVWLEMGASHLPAIQSLVHSNQHWGLCYYSNYSDHNHRSRFHLLKLASEIR